MLGKLQMAPCYRPITGYVQQSGLHVIPYLSDLSFGARMYTTQQIMTGNWFVCRSPIERCYANYHLTLDSIGVLHVTPTCSHLSLSCEVEAQTTSNTLLLRHY